MDLEDDIEKPWWRSLLRVFGIIAGLLALAGISMAFIMFVAKTFNSDARKQDLPVFIDLTSPPPEQKNARTRSASASPWPNKPNQAAAVSFTGGRGDGGERTRGGSPAGAPVAAQEAELAVGLSADEYRKAIESGQKVFLPNPKGNCDITVQNLGNPGSVLDDCFAQRAAR